MVFLISCVLNSRVNERTKIRNLWITIDTCLSWKGAWFFGQDRRGRRKELGILGILGIHILFNLVQLQVAFFLVYVILDMLRHSSDNSGENSSILPKL